MDPAAVRSAFDEQVRQRPDPGGAAGRVEHADGTVRVCGGGWAGVTWSDLDAAGADAAIAAQVDRFRGLGAWEWKHYSYDRPPDLPERLRAAGFAPEPPETLLVAEVADLDLQVVLPSGVTLEPVVDAAGIAALVRLHDEVFGGDHAPLGAALAAQSAADPDSVAAVLAVADGRPVAGGRVEMVRGSAFAGLWGGGTLPGWRRRGLFRALVAHRAALAAAAGFRYLQVDASDDSRPILGRLGFVELATTTPFLYAGPS